MSALRQLLLAGLVASAWLGAPARAAEDAPPETGPGVALLLEEIRTRATALDRREREIAERERALAELEAEVAALLGEIEGVREVVELRISAWEEENGDTVRRLAKIYASMPPARAARLIEGLDLDLATQIVAKMKHKQSAQVLALIDRKRALAMSNQVVYPLRGAPPPAEAAP